MPEIALKTTEEGFFNQLGCSKIHFLGLDITIP